VKDSNSIREGGENCVHAKCRVHVERKGEILGRIGNVGTRERKVNLQLPSCASWLSPSSSLVHAIRPPTQSGQLVAVVADVPA